MSVQFNNRCIELVTELGLISPNVVSSVEPLTGGVSSDIAVVDLGDRKVCVKFALQKLRVAEEWHAPTHRNDAEYAWLEFAGSTVPGSTPALFGRVTGMGGFAMEFIEGDDTYLWKNALLECQPSQCEAAKVGSALGTIHAASASIDFNAAAFQNQADFFDLRLDPYLGFIATVHPALGTALQGLIDAQLNNSLILIHGDVSPKNILFRAGEPIFLDAECATMGDPGFDVAFCLTHLAVKSFHMPNQANTLLNELSAFWASYEKQVVWEDVRRLEQRTCALLPALMLARVDGKSPVEYLHEDARAEVRDFAMPLVAGPPVDLDCFVSLVSECVDGSS